MPKVQAMLDVDKEQLRKAASVTSELNEEELKDYFVGEMGWAEESGITLEDYTLLYEKENHLEDEYGTTIIIEETNIFSAFSLAFYIYRDMKDVDLDTFVSYLKFPNLDMNEIVTIYTTLYKFFDKLDTYFSDTLDGMTPEDSARDLGLL